MAIKTLVINPGSTSTKIGLFEDETLLFDETLRHSTEEISQYASIIDQKDFRKDIIVNFLKEKNFDINSLNVVVGRGGMLKPIPSGTYTVTDNLLEDLKVGVSGQHASNLGGILAREIGDSIGVPSYIVDPVVVDEMEDVARVSGVPEIPRISVFHALNQKAVAKRYAKEIGKPYESLNLICCPCITDIVVFHRYGFGEHNIDSTCFCKVRRDTARTTINVEINSMCPRCPYCI